MVLIGEVEVGDSADGLLDAYDVVLHSWGRPPDETTILSVVGPDEGVLEHWRLKR
jgi:hypothetical protein